MIGRVWSRLSGVVTLVVAVALLFVSAVVAAPDRAVAQETGAYQSVAEQTRVRSDIVYAAPWSSGQTQKLDLYGLTSWETSSGTHPVVVFLHGGAWVSGDKSFLSDRMPLVNTLLQNGYLVASVNYRLASESPWPAQINDAKSAIRFLRANAGKYGIDPDGIAVFGESAGAHLAMMLGVTNDGSRFVDIKDGNGASTSAKVQAVISDFGISDVDDWGKLPGEVNLDMIAEDKNLLFGVTDGGTYSQEQAEDASPLHYVTANAAPMFLAHGLNDTMVSYQQTVMMEQALTQAGAKHVETWYPDEGQHGQVDVFCSNATAQQKYLDFLSSAMPSQAGSSDAGRMVPVYRFYQPSTDTHLFSADADEISTLEQVGWHEEGVAFRVLSGSTGSHSADGREITQMHNAGTGDYVYAGGASEVAALAGDGWTSGASFWAPSTGGTPVHRLYNPESSRHMLVITDEERTTLTAQGWSDEGVAFHAYMTEQEDQEAE